MRPNRNARLRGLLTGFFTVSCLLSYGYFSTTSGNREKSFFGNKGGGVLEVLKKPDISRTKKVDLIQWKEVDSAVFYQKYPGVVEVHQKPDIGPPQQVDPRHWEGLNSSAVYQRFPGVVLYTDYIFNRPFFEPNETSQAGTQSNLNELTDAQAEERFFQLISMAHADCRLVVRMGSESDGGWDVCVVPPYHFKPRDCLIYSFGINYDFTFDDAMGTAFNCTVKSFDPSMSVNDYQRSANVFFFKLGLGKDAKEDWKLMSLRNIRSKLGHSEMVIDLLKFDIDFNEWACLREMATDGSLDNVKQLIFEMHTPELLQRISYKHDFIVMYNLLVLLERAGFRRYHQHANPFGEFTSITSAKRRICCYELQYINIRFLDVER